jgi:acyl carrier protein
MTNATSTPEVERTLFEAIASFGPDIEDVRREATLEELDIDSLDLVELSQVAEETWGVQLTSDHIKDLKTVGDAVDLIASKVP